MSAAVVTASISSTAAVLAIVGSAIGVTITVRQKDRSERRGQFWTRITWAIEKTAADDPYIQQIGWKVLRGLLASDLATDTETAIIEALAASEARGDNEQGQGGNDGNR